MGDFMRIEYLTMYKWENLPDGTKDKFIYRLEALPFELSLKNKLGCADIIMPAYLPEYMYTNEMKNQYEKSKQEYRLRQQKLFELLELIKTKVKYNIKINDEYLYELWISKIFSLDWQDNPLNDITILKEELSLNNEINPFNIKLEKKDLALPKEKRKIFKNLFRRNNKL